MNIAVQSDNGSAPGVVPNDLIGPDGSILSIRVAMVEVAHRPGRGRCPTPLVIRFLEKIEMRGECWSWTAAKAGGGHPRISSKVAPEAGGYAHRLSFLFFNGPIIDDLEVCHKCDNPPCVNPQHLFLGTRSDNIRDCISKGRAGWQRNPAAYREIGRSSGLKTRGETNANNKLTEKEVRAIKHLLSAGVLQIDLADAFGVPKGTIHSIARGGTWSWV